MVGEACLLPGIGTYFFISLCRFFRHKKSPAKREKKRGHTSKLIHVISGHCLRWLFFQRSHARGQLRTFSCRLSSTRMGSKRVSVDSCNRRFGRYTAGSHHVSSICQMRMISRPPPIRFTARTFAPIASAIMRTIARPMPDPLVLRVISDSTR